MSSTFDYDIVVIGAGILLVRNGSYDSSYRYCYAHCPQSHQDRTGQEQDRLKEVSYGKEIQL